MRTLREQLETQQNPFMDTVISYLEELELLASVEGFNWDGEANSCLLRLSPVNVDDYEALKDEVVKRLRAAGKQVRFKAACLEVNLSNVPNMIFKLTQKQ